MNFCYKKFMIFKTS